MDDVLAYMEIPLPDEDDFSEDEFGGYLSSEDEDGQGGDETSGSGDPSSECIQPADIPPYILQQGCAHDMTNKIPISFFKLFVDEDMLRNLVQQTNLYAQQYIASAELGPRSRVHGWSRTPHNLDELTPRPHHHDGSRLIPHS